MSGEMVSTHASMSAPSDWVVRWSVLLRGEGNILDVACGAGRHARLLASRGWHVDAVDRDEAAIAGLRGTANIEALCADIEAGAWPYVGRSFAGIVVTNYLHRPLLPVLVESLAEGGVLIYETFASGNERFGRPSNPAFLLRPGELLDAVRPRLRVISYEDVVVDAPRPAAVQRICARRE